MRILTVVLFLLSYKIVFAQQIAIGTLNGEDKIEFSEKGKRAIKIAYLRSFTDGRKLDTAFIEKLGQVKYLVILGSKNNVKSRSAVSILIINNMVNIATNTEMKTCSNGACTDCQFFIENSKVVACKCNDNGSISNNCSFRNNDGAFFYNVVSKIMESTKN
jgi:hypothetical protein